MRIPRLPQTWELEGDPRFELRRALGTGSFGAVFEVFDRERAAKVALKILRRVDAEDLYRFKQEFRALADIAHPNVVKLYELSGARDRWFFTMELIEGADARAFVRGEADDRCDEARLRSLLRQLVEGLTALHAAGKIHRDIKPSNVLVTHDGRVVLVDFGLAVRLSASGEMSRRTLVGTPEYLAPEMVRGAPATAASDWYAVGVLLFEALTGKLPFQGSLQEILSRKITHDAPAPHDLAPGVPADLDQLVIELLARTPEARPDGAALLARLGGSAAAQRSGINELPFVGRGKERATLVELFQGVRDQGTTAVALVGGVSGIGKSALIARATADVRDASPGAVILAGRCWEQESVPYKAIDGLVDPLSRHLKALPPRLAQQLVPRDIRLVAGLFPVLDQVEAIARAPAPPAPTFDPIARRRDVFRALRDLFTRLAKDRPLVLVIDDLQWGDRDSGAFLIELLAPPSPPPLLLVLSYRSDEVATSECLQTALPALLAMDGPSTRVASIDLAPLADHEARDLALELLGYPTITAAPRGSEPPGRVSGDQIAAAVAHEAGGRPFFIYQLAQAAREHAMEIRAHRATVSLDALVRDRAAELPEAARRLLETIAVAGRPVDRAAASRAAALGDDEPAAYSALRTARLVRSRTVAGHEEIEPYHDRIREAVAGGLSIERRESAFRALAEALDGTGRADVETLAVYYLRGRRPDRAADLAAQAAEEASRSLAFDRAARLFRLALSLRAPDDPRATPLREALADALVTAGRGAEAATELAAVADRAPRHRAYELRRRAAEQLLFAGRMDEGMAALHRCFADMRISIPEGAFRRLLGTVIGLARLAIRGFAFRPRSAEEVPQGLLERIDTLHSASRAFVTVDAILAVYLCMRMIRFALAAGERQRVMEALALFVSYTNLLGGPVAGLVRRGTAVVTKLAEEAADVRSRGVLATLRGANAILTGRPGEAGEQLAAGLASVRELRVGSSWEANILSELTCMALLWTGAWKELLPTLASMLNDARTRGNLHMERNLSVWFGHLPAILDDDPDRAERIHTEARAGWWPPRFGALDHFSMISRADILLYAEHGAGEEAHRHVERCWPDLLRSQLYRLDTFGMYEMDTRARAAIAFAASATAGAEERADAIDAASKAVKRLRRMDNELARGFAEIASAGIAAVRGRERDAIAGYAQAEATLTRAGCDHFAAAAKRRRGLLAGGEEGAARAAEAEAWFAAQGAKNPARVAAMLAPGRLGASPDSRMGPLANQADPEARRKRDSRSS